jgi:hypothetical protein
LNSSFKSGSLASTYASISISPSLFLPAPLVDFVAALVLTLHLPLPLSAFALVLPLTIKINALQNKDKCIIAIIKI